MARLDAALDSVPRFVDAPDDSRADEPLRIRISGLPTHAPMTLRARTRDEAGHWWESEAAFGTDDAGTIDLGIQAPVAGSYAGVDPMAFIWSMAPATGQQVEGPWRRTSVAPAVIELTIEDGGNTLASKRLRRLYLAPGATRTPVRECGLVGTFFAPAGSRPAPAVVVMGGSGGGLSESTAVLFAAHGFPALALAYFRAEQLPPDLVRIPLEYFETAIEWVQAQPSVNPQQVAICGTSRGGELVLLLGSRLPAIKAVIGYVPSGIVYGGLSSSRREDERPEPAWTHQGEGVTFLSSHRDRGGPPQVPDESKPFALTPGFLASLQDEEQAALAAIPVERIGGPVLLISGQADAMWPSAHFSDRVMARLAEHCHPYPDQHLSYPDAGHMIGPPYGPTTVAEMRHPVTSGYFALGGTPEGTAHARSDSWPKVLDFLADNLGRG